MIKYLISEKDECFDNCISDYLDRNPRATIYHLPNYIKILANESGQKIFRIICTDINGNICGYLPLVETKGFPFKIGAPFSAKRLSSLPRTPVGGPIYENLDVLTLLLSYAVTKVKESFAYTLQIKSDDRLDKYSPDLASYLWRKAFIKEIPPLREQIRYKDNRVEKDVVKHVKKMKKDGFQFVEAESITDLKNWYKLYLENARFHQVPARSFNFFHDLWNEFHHRKMIKVNLLVYRDNFHSPLAGTLSFLFKNTIIGAFKGRSFGKRIKYHDDFLHYYEFEQAQKEGCRVFDLGEVACNDFGLEYYKRKWGVEETQIFHNYYSTEKIVVNTNVNTEKKGHLLILFGECFR